MEATPMPNSDASPIKLKKMKLPFGILNMISEKTGLDLHNVADCNYVMNDIESVTNEKLGLNTVKRLLGFSREVADRTPRQTTLDIIAKYLEYPDWTTLEKVEMNSSNSEFGEVDETQYAEDFEEGTLVEISYYPDRCITFRYLGDNMFEVIDSFNSTNLQPGDVAEIHQLTKGFPLLSPKVVRNGENLGKLRAGKNGGLTSIKVF